MSNEYLSDEQVRRYGAFVADPTPEELERFFFLDAAALEVARTKRRRHNRLGRSVQWETIRMLGTFLKDPIDVPRVVVDYAAEQLGIDDPSCVKDYSDRTQTQMQYEHAWEIRDLLGFRDFADAEQEITAYVAWRVAPTHRPRSGRSQSRRSLSASCASTYRCTAPAADRRLFPGARRGPLSESLYGRIWHRTCAEAAIPARQGTPPARRPYDLRHAALSLWLASGAPPAEIAARPPETGPRSQGTDHAKSGPQLAHRHRERSAGPLPKTNQARHPAIPHRA